MVRRSSPRQNCYSTIRHGCYDRIFIQLFGGACLYQISCTILLKKVFGFFNTFRLAYIYEYVACVVVAFERMVWGKVQVQVYQ